MITSTKCPPVLINKRSPLRTYHPLPRSYLPLASDALTSSHRPVARSPRPRWAVASHTQSRDPASISKALLRIRAVCHVYPYIRTRLQRRPLLSVESQEIEERRCRTFKSSHHLSFVSSRGSGSRCQVPQSKASTRSLNRTHCPSGPTVYQDCEV